MRRVEIELITLGRKVTAKSGRASFAVTKKKKKKFGPYVKGLHAEPKAISISFKKKKTLKSNFQTITVS